jgi:hypothetical protein
VSNEIPNSMIRSRRNNSNNFIETLSIDFLIEGQDLRNARVGKEIELNISAFGMEKLQLRMIQEQPIKE